MDCIKIGKIIGKFIAEKRREMHLTEQELANMLHLSEKTILEWESGQGCLDIFIAFELCNILGITINELLCGKKIESYPLVTHTAENKVDIFYVKQDYTIKKWAAICIIILNIFLLGIATVMIPYINVPIWIKITIVVVTLLLLFISIIPVCALTNSMGRFQCKHCGYKFTPKLAAFICGIHTWKKRYLKCPLCQKKSFCKFESYKKTK